MDSVARACADRAVGSASGPCIARAAGDGRAGAHAAILGASLALAGTSRIAADAIDAVWRSALVRAAAGLPWREKWDTDAGRAPSAVRAVGIGAAVAVARGRAAAEGRARLRLQGGAGAGAVARGGERGRSSRAGGVAAGDGVAWIGAGRRMDSVAASSANGTVGRAGAPRAMRRASRG